MSRLTMADALRLAINVLRDAAESRRLPSGTTLDAAEVDLHDAAADQLQGALADLRDHE